MRPSPIIEKLQIFKNKGRKTRPSANKPNAALINESVVRNVMIHMAPVLCKAIAAAVINSFADVALSPAGPMDPDPNVGGYNPDPEYDPDHGRHSEITDTSARFAAPFYNEVYSMIETGGRFWSLLSISANINLLF